MSMCRQNRVAQYVKEYDMRDRQRGYAKYWILAIALWDSSTVLAEPFAIGPYLGQAPPGPIAQVFAPGLVCRTGYPHFCFKHWLQRRWSGHCPGSVLYGIQLH